MPLPRVLLVSFAALTLTVLTLWSMDLNLAGWIGSWFSADQQMQVGLAIVMITGIAGGWVYVIGPGSRLPGPGAIRGAGYGLLIAALFIWALPTILSGTATATKTMRGIATGSFQDGKQAENSPVPKFPEIKGVKPPLADFTAGKKWQEKEDWQGRLAPFLIAFGLYGLMLGLFLSEDPKKKKKE